MKERKWDDHEKNEEQRSAAVFHFLFYAKKDMQISNLTLAYMKCTYCTLELPNYYWVIVQSLLVLNCQFTEII